MGFDDSYNSGVRPQPQDNAGQAGTTMMIIVISMIPSCLPEGEKLMCLILEFGMLFHMTPDNYISEMISQVGGFCALSGVFILTLPIPIVVNRFLKIDLAYIAMTSLYQ